MSPRWRVTVQFLPLTVIAVVAVLRITVIRSAVSPGHADPSFYYGVAQNIGSGRGPVVDYAWHFLTGQPALPRYAFDYWYPLPSYAMSLAMRLRNSLPAAIALVLLVSVIASAGVAWLVWELVGTTWSATCAAALYFVQPSVAMFSVSADSPMFLAAFATLALAAGVRARSHPRFWLVAGIFAGLANASRSEGLIVAGCVIVVAALQGHRRDIRFRCAAAAAVGYVVAMAPVFALNLAWMGRPTPSSALAFPFIRDYEQLFSTHIDMSVDSLFSGGPRALLANRWEALSAQVSQSVSGFGLLEVLLLMLLAGLALGRSRVGLVKGSVGSRLQSPWTLPLLTFIAVEAFFILVIPTLSTASLKWESLFQPTLIAGAMLGLARSGWTVSKLLPVIAVVAVVPLISSVEISRTTVTTNNLNGVTVSSWTSTLAAESKCFGRPAVLMTRTPWDTTQTTGYRSVMVPNDDLAVILGVARRYHVTDLQLANKRTALAQRSTLTRAGGPLIHIDTTDSTGIFRLRQAGGATGCDGAKG